MNTPSDTAIFDAARTELALAAASAERANTPKLGITLAAILLVAALIYMLTGVYARIRAQIRVDTARSHAAEIVGLADQFNAYVTGPADARFAPDPFMASKLEDQARLLGLRLTGGVSISDQGLGASVTGLVQRRFSVRASNQDPLAIFEFLRKSQDKSSFPGLEFSNIALRPEADSSSAPTPPVVPGTAASDEPTYTGGWNISIDFQRWERR